MALATVADYETITGLTVASGADTDRVEALLDLASSAILAGAHGQQIESAVVTAETIRPYEGVGYFAQRPVTAVASVTYDGDTLTAGTDYRFTAGGDRRPAKLIRVINGYDAEWREPLTVTYTAGWDPVPGQIIAAVVAMTYSAATNGAQAPTTQITVGPFSRSGDAAEAQSPAMALNPSTQAVLDNLCTVRGFASIQVQPG
jgi:hypothetical protein